MQQHNVWISLLRSTRRNLLPDFMSVSLACRLDIWRRGRKTFVNYTDTPDGSPCVGRQHLRDINLQLMRLKQ